MVELVGDDRVLRVEQALEETAVGVEAAAVQNAVLHAVELGDQSLQLLVDVRRTADETHGGQSESVSVQSVLGGVNQVLAVGETEVVVGAEVQHLVVAALHADLGSLLAGDHTLLLEGSGSLDVVELLSDSLVQLRSVGSNRKTLSHSCLCWFGIESERVIVERDSARNYGLV